MRAVLFALAAIGAALTHEAQTALAAQARSAEGNCVAIATPKPALGFTYEHTESTGVRTQFTDHWESITPTTSRVRTTGRPGGPIVSVNEYEIVDDVAVLAKMSQLNARGVVMNATAFRPGLVSDPAFRACAGRSWPIRSVTASYQGGGQNASAQTPAGTLRIVNIRERVTVPAGTFDTVRYIRTSQTTDEYWKSIEHGVIVKHTAALPNGQAVSQVLVSIK